MPTDHVDLQAVLFDLDDTLNDRQQSWITFVKRMADPLTGHLQTCVVTDVYRTIVAVDQGGYGDKKTLFECMSRLPWKSPKTADGVEHLWREHFPKSMVTRKGVFDVLAKLRELGVRTGIVTNGRDDGQRNKLEEMGLSQAVDIIVTSGGMGFKKPDPRIYHAALSGLDVSAGHTLFVGDSPQSDVVGPAKADMRTAWMANGRNWSVSDVQPDFILEEFSDLMSILSRLHRRWA